jgi:hypothetical protein
MSRGARELIARKYDRYISGTGSEFPNDCTKTTVSMATMRMTWFKGDSVSSGALDGTRSVPQDVGQHIRDIRDDTLS